MKLLRNYAILLGAVLLLTALFCGLYFTGFPLRADEVVVDPKDPLTADLAETGHADLVRLVEHALQNGTVTTEKPGTGTGIRIPLQTRTAGGVTVNAYTLHILRMIDRSALLEDLKTGTVYRISAADFTLLLTHEAFAGVAERKTPQPEILSQSDLDLMGPLPYEYKFKLFQPDGSVKTSSGKSEEIRQINLTPEQAAEYELSGNPSPDAWSVTVTKNGTDFLTQDRTESLYFPQEPGKYQYTVTAHWNLNRERDWYGEAVYVFEISITEPEPPEDLPENPEEEDPNP